MKKNNLNILITGSSRGIGKAIALKLSPRCENLLLTSKNKNSCLNTYKETSLYAKNVYYSNFNHDDPVKAADNLAKWAKENVTHLDALLLDAGIFIEGNLSDIDYDSFTNNMNVNVFANYLIAQKLIPLLEKAETPRIIIIGSTAAYNVYPSVPSYGVAKWALRGYAYNLREELKNRNIGVTFVSPGGTLTDMWNDVDVPKGRLLEPNDIAEVVNCCFELSNQAVIEEIIIKPMLGDYDED